MTRVIEKQRSLHAVAEAQKDGGTCAFVDAEHALDPVYARKLGVNIDDLLISQPDVVSRHWKSLTRLCVQVRPTSLVSTLSRRWCRAEIEGEMGDHHVDRTRADEPGFKETNIVNCLVLTAR